MDEGLIVKAQVRRLLKNWAVRVVITVVAWVLDFLPFVILLGYGLNWLIKKQLTSDDRFYLRMSGILVVLKTIGIVSLSAYLSSQRIPANPPIPLMILAPMVTPGMVEAEIRSRVNSISPDKPDPFTGEALRPLPGSNDLYSIGPDRIDQQGALIYNPTNGIISDGDIIVPVK